MSRSRRGERGSIGIWAVLVVFTIIAFMALAIHAGRTYSNRAELQNAADAAALAAAAQLDGTQAGIDAATAAAAQLGAAHATENVSVSIAPEDVVFGSWDRTAQAFTPIPGRTAGDLQRIIAVQVHDARLDLPVELGGFLGGGTSTDVRAAAVAAGGGPCDDRCAFPGAFADCMILNADGTLRCEDRFFVLNNDWQDNFGLTSLDPNVSASVPNIKAALDQCVETSAGTPVPVNNGNPIQPIFGTGHTGTYPLETVAPVVHDDDCISAHYETCTRANPTDPCTNAKFVGDMPIVGYVSIILCYVTGPNVKTWPPADWGVSTTPEQAALWNECGPAPTQADFPGVPDTAWPNFLAQTLFIKQRCHFIDPGTRTHKAGCQSFGVWTTRSRLVQ